LAVDSSCKRFVVLGFPRSGTTLLRRLLDAHPEVSCPPETNLISACGRFLESTPSVDGLTVGVLSGLAFSGVPRSDVLDELRRLVFGLHERIAAGKPVWVEKTAFDIFYLDAVEELLAGHCRFICVVRSPLDVIVSVKDLFDGMDRILPEMHGFVRRNTSLFDAYAEAWIDRMEALGRFMTVRPDDCVLIRYEDLVANPAQTLGTLTQFMGVAPAVGEMLDAAFSRPAAVGLGDWNTYSRPAIGADSVGRWRSVLPASTVARLVPRLEPLMRTHGYEPPQISDGPEGAAAIRKYELTMQVAQTFGRRG
jgi:hypothetical protein